MDCPKRYNPGAIPSGDFPMRHTPSMAPLGRFQRNNIMTASDTFRQNIRRQMAAQKISQRDLAEIIGTSTSYVNRVLQGRISPSIENADSFARAVGLTIHGAFRAAKTRA